MNVSQIGVAEGMGKGTIYMKIRFHYMKWNLIVMIGVKKLPNQDVTVSNVSRSKSRVLLKTALTQLTRTSTCLSAPRQW